MANCNHIFTEFNSIIRLNDTKRKSLKKSRKSLRDKIRKYFREQRPNEIFPKFNGQGSLLMDTTVEPIPREVEENGETRKVYYYDVDDGIYFIGEIKDRKEIQTYHNWIVAAVDGHTSIPPVDKNTCVRVLFADGHNIDMPIYFKHDDIPELAHKTKSWIDSDPRAFLLWFESKVKDNEQLRRIVRYLKAWSDFRKFSNESQKMPSGFILTILACNNYYQHERDDIAFKETLILIQNVLQQKFECLRPTVPKGEDLLANYGHKNYFMNCLQNLINDAKEALEEKNQKKSCEKWQKHFGDRFPCSLAKDEDEQNSAIRSLAGVAAGSRPWCDTQRS